VTVQTSGVHLYDYLGSSTRVSYRRGWDRHAFAEGRSITPSRPPVNEHYLDWIALLSAVVRGAGVFRMAEFGAGWAPWLARAALACRQRPQITDIELLAIEADAVHFGWTLEHLASNGVDLAKVQALLGAVAAEPGLLRFPVIADPDVDYGASLYGASSMATGTVDVRAYSVDELLDRFTGPLDFLHVDIQGAEYDTLPPAMERLKRDVKSIMVGTHLSDARHEGLAEAFCQAGWTEVLRLPRNQVNQTPWGEIPTNDGFLLFDNPKFI
jgi:FkbM family methyltransferase